MSFAKLFFSMVLRQHCFSKRIETVCVCVCGGAVTACLSRFFLKLLRQHSLSKRIEVECMCVFWVAVTASLNFLFYSCCCFFNGAATALLF